MGWGVAVIPELLARAQLETGALVAIRPDVAIDVALYWHQWKLAPGLDDAEQAAPARPGLLEQIGQALILGASEALGSPA
ncbi:MAG TPA: ArgP/LysG family DNA-binding transcriptional regulator, partial [Burkholderiaceae bacterium]|nr:ArgP/LysG family DNA-binding transcriptional regulator [Burkholderiaceae bacterium]